MQVDEEKISIQRLCEDIEAGRVEEIFGSGTAAVISPVGELKYGEQVISIGDGTVGPIATRLYTAMTDIQYGKAPDTMGWIEGIG